MQTQPVLLVPYAHVPPVSESGTLSVIVDTPKGSRNKFAYDPAMGLFKLDGVLPLGAVFPFDFGYLPPTRGGDGDPLDVQGLMDQPAFGGCLVPSRPDPIHVRRGAPAQHGQSPLRCSAVRTTVVPRWAAREHAAAIRGAAPTGRPTVIAQPRLSP